MHIILEDQVSGQKSVVCVDRDSSHCEVIRVDPETLPAVLSILASMKVPTVTIVSTDDPAAAGILSEMGWQKDEHAVVWRMKTNGR